MKLKDILIEMSLEKGKWTVIPQEEIKAYADQIFKLISIAYSGVQGGHLRVKSIEDIDPKDKEYDVIDVDDDNEIDALSVTKQTPAGTKMVGTGHDGTMDAKRALLKHKTDQLKQNGYYVEASGKIKDVFIARGVAIVHDEATVRKALKGKEIEWVGDGTYYRDIGGVRVMKTMLGKPRV